MELEGLHHLTAVTGDPSANIAFYTQLLGMRLIKKTVNQDDVSAYHLFYGDETGRPGTELTFFDWPHAGPARRGPGSIATVSLRVGSAAALERWILRFDEYGIPHEGLAERAGRASVTFRDPEGQSLVLVDDGGAPGGVPWTGSPVPAEMAVKGLHAVRIPVVRPEPTAKILTGVLGFRQTREYRSGDGSVLLVFEVGPGGPGAEVHLEVVPGPASSRVGIGGVHHVAFRTPTPAEHQDWHRRLSEAGVGNTPIIDRFYFRSIYFREPGGVLFEIATDGPGFATDEDAGHLGEKLALPPFLEASRARIEAGLKPIAPAKLAPVK